MSELSVGFAFDPRWRRATLAFLLITTLLRLLQIGSMELVPDEAYYWDWSRRLSLGYYDQGPFIAYLLRVTTTIFGQNEFGVRVGIVLLSLGTLLACEALARRLFSSFAGFVTVLALGTTPLMAVGSAIATYDPPMVFFWAVGLLCLERALFAEELATQRRAWFWAGIATGFGLLSKHTALLVIPCLVLFLALSPKHRFWLRRPEPYLAFGITLLLYSGVLYWNAQHHWWTFQHLLFLTKKTFDTIPKRFGDYLGSQALLLGPVLFFGVLGACRWGWKRKTEQGDRDERMRFLVCMGLPVFLLFCLMTLKAKVQGNWSPHAWLTLVVLWAGWLGAGEQKRALRGLVLVAATSGFLTLALLSSSLRLALGIHLPAKDDLSNTAYGWREMASHVQKARERLEAEGKPVFIAANGYEYAGQMAFYLPDRPQTFDMFIHFRLTMYAAYVERLKEKMGQNAIFVTNHTVEDRYLREIFERVEWEPPIPIWRRPYSQEPVRTLYIARCYGYRKYTGLDWAEGG